MHRVPSHRSDRGAGRISRRAGAPSPSRSAESVEMRRAHGRQRWRRRGCRTTSRADPTWRRSGRSAGRGRRSPSSCHRARSPASSRRRLGQKRSVAGWRAGFSYPPGLDAVIAGPPGTRANTDGALGTLGRSACGALNGVGEVVKAYRALGDRLDRCEGERAETEGLHCRTRDDPERPLRDVEGIERRMFSCGVHSEDENVGAVGAGVSELACLLVPRTPREVSEADPGVALGRPGLQAGAPA